MINLKISMISGEVFLIKNMSPYITTVKEWIKHALMPHGTQKPWVEIIKDVQIQVCNIEVIKEITDEDARVLIDGENDAEAENDTGDERVEEIPENLDTIKEVEDEGTKTSK